MYTDIRLMDTEK